MVAINVVNNISPSQVNRTLNLIRPYLCGLDSYYPRFDLWFQKKVIPGMYSGNRSIVQIEDNNSIVAFAILKHIANEQKICTFFVDKRCRRSGVGSLLMSKCLNSFSRKPVITVTESLLDKYGSLLEKFQFGRPLVWASAYKKNVTEYIFDPGKTILPTENNGFFYLE